MVRVELRAEEGSELPDDLEEREPAAPPPLLRLVVYGPGDDQDDDAEEAHGGRVHGDVADRGSYEFRSCGPRQGEDEVAGCREQRVRGDERRARLHAIGHVCREQDHAECEEVRGRGEGLGPKLAVAHVFENGGEEGGERAVGHVGEEEHEGREPRLGVFEGGEDVFGSHARGRGRWLILTIRGGERRRVLSAAVRLGFLVPKAQERNLSLPRTEIRGRLGRIWYHAPCDRRDDDGREALEKE